MHIAAALPVAPVGSNDGTGDDPCALAPAPADGFEKGLRALDVPIGEEKFGVGGEGVNDFTAEDAVLIARLQVAVGAERLRGDVGG